MQHESRMQRRHHVLVVIVENVKEIWSEAGIGSTDVKPVRAREFSVSIKETPGDFRASITLKERMDLSLLFFPMTTYISTIIKLTGTQQHPKFSQPP